MREGRERAEKRKRSRERKREEEEGRKRVREEELKGEDIGGKKNAGKFKKRY